MKRIFATLSLLCAASLTAFTAVDFPDPLSEEVARISPSSLIGQIFFSSGAGDYIGSGIVIRPSSVLTAGHNLYDPDNGWSTDLLFRRAAYGTRVASEQYASRVFLLGGYSQAARTYGADSARSFASDTGGLLFAKPPAGGGYAGYTSNTTYATRADVYKVAIGYGAVGPHDGYKPLYVAPTRGFYRTYGGFYENNTIFFEGGMSGGPLFVRLSDGKYYVSGVIVSGSPAPYSAGGVRILDQTVASFISGYLR